MHAERYSLAQQVGKVPDLIWAPFWEGAVILLAAATAFWSGYPWLFSSLGATVYEMIEKPARKSSKPYSILIGHGVAMGCGFAAVAICGAWTVPTVNAHSHIPAARVWAAALAVTLTVAINLLLKASQPAACSTTLLVSLGAMQTAHAALWIAVGVAIVTVVAEPLRRLREPVALARAAQVEKS